MSSSESLNDCSSDMSSEVKDSATRQTKQFSSGNCSVQNSNSKQGSEAGNQPVEGDDIGFRNFLEEYTIIISEVAARFWEKMPDSQRAMFYDRSEIGKKPSVASSANDREETGSSSSRGWGCEPKPQKKKSCARPMRKACPKSMKYIKRRYSKPKCQKPRAPKRCPKPRAAKTCPKPRAAKRCPKPMSAKKFPKPNPVCPMPRVLIQSEDPKPAFPRPMALIQSEDPRPAFPRPKLPSFHFDNPTPIPMEIIDLEGPN